MRPCRSRTFSTPASRARATSSISGEESTPTTACTYGAIVAATRPDPQPRSPTVTPGSSRAGQQLQVARLAVQDVAQPIPLAGDVGEERGRVALAAVQHLLAPAQVEPHRHGLREALAHELPEPTRGLVELIHREGVAPARAVATGGDPACVREQLEMARCGGLRQRERVA